MECIIPSLYAKLNFINRQDGSSMILLRSIHCWLRSANNMVFLVALDHRSWSSDIS